MKCLLQPLKRTLFFFSAWGLFVFIAQLQRVAILLNEKKHFQNVPNDIILQSFFIGNRFDGAIAAYFCILLLLMYTLLLILNREKQAIFATSIIFTILLFIYGGLLVGEINYFSYFSSRYTSYLLNWFEHFSFVTSMLWNSYPIVKMFLALCLILIPIVIAFHYFKRKLFSPVNTMKVTQKIFFFIFTSLLLGITARGTLEHKSPLRWGKAFFSSYPIANKLALNSVFSFISDVRGSRKKAQSFLGKAGFFNSLEDASNYALSFIDKKAIINSDYTTGYRRFISKKGMVKKYNIVLVLVESFASEWMSYYNGKNGKVDIVPKFRKLRTQGIYFDNFYANGYHTFIGVFSSLSSMPHVYGRSMMKRTEAQEKVGSIASILKPYGYESVFMVPHDPHFDNMAGFLINNDYDKIISAYDFADSERLTTLGVPDHMLFDRAIKMMRNYYKKKKNFQITILTSNNHGPYKVANLQGYKKLFPNKKDDYLATFHYSDFVVARFLKEAKKLSGFNNTIFVITGDHGAYLPPDKYDINLSSVKIPFLIYAPKIIQPKIISTIGYQVDLVPTVLSLLNISYATTHLGRDLFNIQKNSGFAFFEETDTLGFIQGDYYLIDKLSAKARLYNLASTQPEVDISLQNKTLFQNMRKKTRALFFLTNKSLLQRKKFSTKQK